MTRLTSSSSASRVVALPAPGSSVTVRIKPASWVQAFLRPACSGLATLHSKVPLPSPAGVLGVNDKSVGILGSSVGVIGAWGNTDKGLGVVGTANLGAGAPTDQITDQGIGVIGLGVTARCVQNCTLTRISGRFRTRAASLARRRQVGSAMRLHPVSGAKPVRNP